MHVPSEEEFEEGHKAYEKNEPRDAMYKVASFLVKHFWGNPTEMTNGLGVLLLTWNQAFYRGGSFDFDKLEKVIETNFQKIEGFRKRNIFTLLDTDEENIKYLFNEFLDALVLSSGKRKGTKGYISVAKALHPLAPGFFPLWDEKIAKKGYGCYYNQAPAEEYFKFCIKMKKIAETVKNYGDWPTDKLLKRIDEYNYAKYTKGWI